MTRDDKRWTLDGLPIDLGEFLSANREALTVHEAERIVAMEPGEQVEVGGGAGASFMLRCEEGSVLPRTAEEIARDLHGDRESDWHREAL